MALTKCPPETATQWFFVDNYLLKANSEGVNYLLTKDINNLACGKVAKWGTYVFGKTTHAEKEKNADNKEQQEQCKKEDKFDKKNWVASGDLFLPLKLWQPEANKAVLVLLSLREAIKDSQRAARDLMVQGTWDGMPPGMHTREGFLKGVAKAYGIDSMALPQHDQLRSLTLLSFDKVLGHHTEAFQSNSKVQNERRGRTRPQCAQLRATSAPPPRSQHVQCSEKRLSIESIDNMENLRPLVPSNVVASPVDLVRLPLSDGSDKLVQAVIVGETRLDTASNDSNVCPLITSILLPYFPLPSNGSNISCPVGDVMLPSIDDSNINCDVQ